MLYASNALEKVSLTPLVSLSKAGLTVLSYTSFILDQVSLKYCFTVPVIVSIDFRLFSSASFILSLLSIIGFVIRFNISLPIFINNSEAPIIASEIPPKIFATICLAVSDLKTSKISAIATEKLPIKSAISPVIFIVLTNQPFILSLYSSSHLSIPPIKHSAILAPTDAIEPTTLPKLNASLFINSFAAACTSESLKISIILNPIFFI